MKRAALALTALGLAQMAGDISGLAALKGLAAATAASPAPRVFSAVRGFETFSVAFQLSWREGAVQRTEVITRELNAELPGPYNLRNVYGAVLAYGPVLPAALRDPVTRYAFCGERPLLKRMGFSPGLITEPIRVSYRPRAEARPKDLPLELEVRCP